MDRKGAGQVGAAKVWQNPHVPRWRPLGILGLGVLGSLAFNVRVIRNVPILLMYPKFLIFSTSDIIFLFHSHCCIAHLALVLTLRPPT